MKNESLVQQEIRLKASQKGIILWRNNSGCMKTPSGGFVRFGLGNESKEMNERFKSADLIGITPYVITADDIGKTVGIFTSIEVKREGWKNDNSTRSKGQFAWAKLITKLGGVAKIISSPNDL